MRIEGMDASNVSFSTYSGSTKTVDAPAEIKVERPAAKVVELRQAPVEVKNFSHMTDMERKELSISDKVVIDAIEKANKAISVSGRMFEYSIHEKTKEIMIKVIDADTKEVIREIPPEKTLDMVAKMWEMAGILVDERR